MVNPEVLCGGEFDRELALPMLGDSTRHKITLTNGLQGNKVTERALRLQREKGTAVREIFLLPTTNKSGPRHYTWRTVKIVRSPPLTTREEYHNCRNSRQTREHKGNRGVKDSGDRRNVFCTPSPTASGCEFRPTFGNSHGILCRLYWYHCAGLALGIRRTETILGTK